MRKAGKGEKKREEQEKGNEKYNKKSFERSRRKFLKVIEGDFLVAGE